LPVLLVLIIGCVVISFLTPYCLTASNIFNVLRQISVYAILAIGEALIIITGEIDLSIGYMMGLCGVLTALMAKAGIPAVLIVIAVVAFGAALASISGFLVTKFGINSFIATLGMQNICRGVSLLLTGGISIMVKSPVAALGSGYLGPMPISSIIMLVAIVAFTLFVTYTQLGRNIFAVGSNVVAANFSGVNSSRVKIAVFAISGMLVGLGGIISYGTLKAADPTAGAGYELDAIAAVVIGGTSMAGGEGTIIGVLIGAAIMGVLKNAFVLLKISAYWQVVVLGFVIIAAVFMDSLKRLRAEK
ncbi:MAG: ABC transporter permease, partial [Firmicutes bacterium]|nr:ABC transporter permease [Bacillota bacterium]